MSKSVALKPLLSEKSHAMSKKMNTYVFAVPLSVNSMEVAAAVKKQFQVSVIAVRMARVSGKPQRSIRGRGRSVRNFRRADVKKAYVRLKEGDSLPIFAATDEAAKKAKPEEKK